MQKVAYLHGPYDTTDGVTGTAYELETAYLVDDRHIMYIDADGDLWLEPARKVDGRETLYIPSDSASGIRIATNVERGEIVIDEIYARLTAMTGWAFLTNVLIPSDNAIELELAE